MRGDISISVVCGGTSRENEVSRVSGRCVKSALEKSYRNVTLLELTTDISRKLGGIDVVFPLLHGSPGEDGTFQGLLDILGIPYVGSGVLASAAAMDKVVAKSIFAQYRLPLAPHLVFGKGDCMDAGNIIEELGSDVVIKPPSQGSALGVYFCKNEEEIMSGLKKAFDYGERVLVEKRIEGREITVGILEREGIEPLPVVEVRTPEGSWYDYKHRYTKGLSEHTIPAPLEESIYRQVQEYAIRAHRALCCRDLSRSDFLVRETGEIVILELNTLPGMTPTSLYPDAATVYGIPFEALVSYLVEKAYRRGESGRQGDKGTGGQGDREMGR